jgi:Zn-dependent protease with chaperone function
MTPAMNGELLAKCGCAHCGNHIEFPVEAAGARVECPHCGQPTELSLQAPLATAGDRPTAAQLMEAFGGPVARTRVSLLYRMGLMLVTLMMILLPLAYVGLIAAAVYGVYAYAAHFTFLLHPGYGGARFYVGRLALYFAPLFGGAVLVFFMVKPLFARRGPHAQPLAMNPALEPELYAFIARICDLVGVPMPQRIDLICDLNAAASFRRGAASLLRDDLVLTIGLPLVAGLNLQQFAGIIAHEFGHFAQGFGMRLSYIIRSINGWFVRVVYERDAWDMWLEELGMEAQDAGILIIVNCARLGVGTSRLVLKLLMLLAHMVSCFLLRQMEYDADSYEIKIAGSGAAESAMRKMAELGEALGRSYKEMRATWNLSRRLPDDFPAYLVVQHAKLPAALCQRLQDRLGLAQTGLFDTHPSDGDRIRRARQAGEPGVFHLALPASVLFSRFDIVSRQVTHLHYAEDLGLVFDVANLRPVEGVVAPPQEG